MRVPVYILAGGRSARFGSDKARARIGGRTMLEHVAERLAPAAQSLTVVAREEGAYGDLGLRTIADAEPGLGPLGGLLTAFSDLGKEDWLLLAACDWAGLRGEWTERLVAGINPLVRCVVFRDARLQPLFALYHASARGEAVRAAGEGRLAMQGLVERLPRKELPPPPGWSEAVNVNAPGELPEGPKG